MPRPDRRPHLASLGIATWLLVAAGCGGPTLDEGERCDPRVRARAWLENGETARALEVFERLAAATGSAGDLANLAVAESRAGHPSRARASWERALAADPRCVRALVALAAQRLDEARALESGDPGRSDAAAQARAARDTARTLLQRAARVDPRNAAVFRKLAQAHQAAGDSVAAAAAWAEAERLDPGRAGARADLFGLDRIAIPSVPRPATRTRTFPRLEPLPAGIACRGPVTLALAAGPRVFLRGVSDLVSCEITPAGSLRSRSLGFEGRHLHLVRSLPVDGDGESDLVWVQSAPGGNGFDAYLAPSADPRRSTRFAHFRQPVQDLVVVDADGDGDADLVAARDHRPGLQMWRNDAGTLVVERAHPGLASLPPARRVVRLDADGDGRGDLLVLLADGAVRLLRGDEAGAFVDVTVPSGLEGVRATALAWRDLDGDGDPEVLLGDDGGLWIYTNTGAARFERTAAYRTADRGWRPGAVAGVTVVALGVADLDDDGWPDVVTCHPEVAEEPFAVRAGDPVGQEDAAPPQPGRAGRPDRVHHGGPARGRLVVWRNQGGGVFEEVTSRAGLDTIAVVPGPFVLADVDGDRDVEWVGIGSEGRVRVARNTLDAAHGALVVQLEGPPGVLAGVPLGIEVHAGFEVFTAPVEHGVVVLGVGTHRRLDVLRLVAPQGRTRNLLDLDLDATPVLRLALPEG